MKLRIIVELDSDPGYTHVVYTKTAEIKLDAYAVNKDQGRIKREAEFIVGKMTKQLMESTNG